jgi:predicted amidohydrolase
VPGDIAGNLARMEPLARRAVEDGARLVLFGEGGVTGYRPDAPTVAAGDSTWRALQAMASRLQSVIAAGFLERDGSAIHTTHGVFYPDGRVVAQRKHMPAPGMEGLLPGWEAGPAERTLFDVEGVPCAMAICADTGIPRLHDILARQGVRLLLVPTAGCGPRRFGFSETSLDEPAVFEEYLKRAESVVFPREAIVNCRRYRMALAACNQMADDGKDYFHPGHAMIVDGSGELAALIPGSFVFEHLRPNVAVGVIRPRPPRSDGDGTS